MRLVPTHLQPVVARPGGNRTDEQSGAVNAFELRFLIVLEAHRHCARSRQKGTHHVRPVLEIRTEITERIGMITADWPALRASHHAMTGTFA